MNSSFQPDSLRLGSVAEPGTGAAAPREAMSDKLDALVDGLVERGHAVIPAFLEPGQLESLRADCLHHWQEGGFRRAGVGQRGVPVIREDVRRDFVHWLEAGELTPAQRQWWSLVDELRLRCNRQMFLGLDRYEAHFALYPPGGFYKPHLDRHRNSPARAVTLLLYLNENWTEDNGGQFRLYTTPGTDRAEGPFVDIQPQGNTVVAFLSADFWHEVLPAQRERMSITGWLRLREDGVL